MPSAHARSTLRSREPSSSAVRCTRSGRLAPSPPQEMRATNSGCPYLRLRSSSLPSSSNEPDALGALFPRRSVPTPSGAGAKCRRLRRRSQRRADRTLGPEASGALPCTGLCRLRPLTALPYPLSTPKSHLPRRTHRPRYALGAAGSRTLEQRRTRKITLRMRHAAARRGPPGHVNVSRAEPGANLWSPTSPRAIGDMSGFRPRTAKCRPTG